MKPVIVVGMDFSDGALNALNFAIYTANSIGANIMLVWVEKKKNTMSIYSDASDPRLEVKKRFEHIIEANQSKLVNGKFMYKMRNGKIYRELVNQAKYHDAVMVVAGTHGASGFEEFWIGSNAYKIVSFSECPVVTIRNEYPCDKAVEKILVPIDSTRETRQKLPLTAKLAKLYKAKVILLSLYSTQHQTIKDLVDGYTDQAKKYLDDREIENEVHSTDASNLTETTIEFAKEHECDLISIMTEQETSTANLLLGPYAQQMVNHCPIPVLSFRSKSIYDWQTK
ncbi:MAG: universal stress protein [Bacteroidales bacterium]|nr:universal stress protein [Bacteroidales bacterium]